MTEPGTLARAIEVVRDLNTPDASPESDYLRGQAELIADLFGYPMEATRDFITAIGTGESP